MFELDHVQVAMPEGQEEQARNFYGKIVGLEEVAKPATLAARGGVWFKLGDRQLHLGVESPFAPARKAHPGIACNDLEALISRLQEGGHHVTRDDNLQDTARIFTEDPFGNRLEFLSSRSR